MIFKPLSEREEFIAERMESADNHSFKTHWQAAWISNQFQRTLAQTRFQTIRQCVLTLRKLCAVVPLR